MKPRPSHLCAFCGTALDDSERICPLCHQPSLPVAPQPIAAPVVGRRPSLPCPSADARVTPARLLRVGDTRPPSILRGATLVGTLIVAEPATREPAESRSMESVRRGLVTLEVLSLFALGLVWLLSTGHVLPLIALGLGLFVLARVARPLGLLAVGRSLHSRHAPRDAATRHYRLRTQETRQEVSLRATGELRGSHLMAGDDVQVYGRWRWGVFHVRHAVNLRTGARSSFHPTAQWSSLLIHALVLGLVASVILPTLLGRLGGRP